MRRQKKVRRRGTARESESEKEIRDEGGCKIIGKLSLANSYNSESNFPKVRELGTPRFIRFAI